MSADSGKAQPVDLKAAMDSASRLRWAAAHSSELVRAADEFDAARQVVAALVEALKAMLEEDDGGMAAAQAKAALKAAGGGAVSGIVRVNTQWKDSQCAAWAEDAQEEIDRLTRELAEAKARSLPYGWVAVPVEPITGENYENGLWSRRNWAAALEDMLSARPESPPYGLPKKQLVPSAADLLDEFEARTKALSCQHEVPERGYSSYNWQIAMIREMRAWIARPDAPKLEDSDYE